MDHHSRYYKEASKRVKEKKDFYQHLASYVIIVTFFSFIGGFHWFKFPAFFWGIGLISHFLSVFNWSKEDIETIAEDFGFTQARNDDDEMELYEDDSLYYDEPRTSKRWDDSEFV